MDTELLFAIGVTLGSVAFVFYPLFFVNEEEVSTLSPNDPSLRQEALLRELKEEFDAGKITEESYDQARKEIESLKAE